MNANGDERTNGGPRPGSGRVGRRSELLEQYLGDEWVEVEPGIYAQRTEPGPAWPARPSVEPSASAH